MRASGPGDKDGDAVPGVRARAALRLAGAVLLASTVVVLGQAAATVQLSARTAVDEAAATVAAHARSLPDLVPGAAAPDQDPRLIRTVMAQEGYLRLIVLDVDGSVLLDLASPDGGGRPPRSGAGDRRTREDDARLVREVGAHDDPVVESTADGLAVSARSPSSGRVLQAYLDEGRVHARASLLRTPTLAVLVLGALAFCPLFLLAGAGRHLREHRRLVRLAYTDPATGLGNDRRFEADLPVAVERSRHGERLLSLCLIQLDGLTAVADADGRSAAHDLLRRAAAVVDRYAREAGGTAYRRDDGTLAALVRLDGPGAGVLVDRMRSGIASCATPLTADTAVACRDHRCPDADSLRVGAEQALARAREQRALVELFAAMGRAGDGAPSRSITLPAGTPLGGSSGASDAVAGSERGSTKPGDDSDIWDLDWFDERP